jgi:hypothetical protein
MWPFSPIGIGATLASFLPHPSDGESAMAIGMTFSAIALSVAMVAALPVHAQQPSDGHQHAQQPVPTEPASPQAPGGMKGRMPGMNMSGMKASQARLDELVKKMNAATGEARVDAAVELLTALVEQRGQSAQMMGGGENAGGAEKK